MPAKAVSAITQPIKDKLRRADHSELTSSGFWIGHLLMVAATILGVYLAAQAGLKQAIQFNEITSLEANYYLRQSLADELTANVVTLKAYNNDYFSRAISANELQQNNPRLSRYVWESMKFSPATLETPSYFLNEVQAFYRQVDTLIEKGEQRIYAASYAGGLLAKQLEHMETVVLPALRGNIDQLKASLDSYGVTVNAPVLSTAP